MYYPASFSNCAVMLTSNQHMKPGEKFVVSSNVKKTLLESFEPCLNLKSISVKKLKSFAITSFRGVCGTNSEYALVRMSSKQIMYYLVMHQCETRKVTKSQFTHTLLYVRVHHIIIFLNVHSHVLFFHICRQVFQFTTA